MALLDVDFFSDTLEMGASMTVVLPQPTKEQIGVDSEATPATDFPLLYLLHGLSDDHTAWLRYTSVERYAAAAGVAVVMPAVARSFYADEAHGHRYWSFLSEELPEIVGNFFKVTASPARTFVAGLSMGGYGALRLGLTHPDRFAAVASLSGVGDLRAALANPTRDELLQRVFGGWIGPDADLHALLGGSARPRLWIGCGTEDVLYPGNLDLVERAVSAGYDVTTDFPPGDHEWGLWDRQLPTVIDWMLHP